MQRKLLQINMIEKKIKLQYEQVAKYLKSFNNDKNTEYSYETNNLNLLICKDTFLSYYFNGWNIFTPKLRELIKEDEEFLEIGASIAISSLLLAKDGVNVTAIDTNNKMIKNILLNAEKNNINLNKVFLSDIYDGFHSEKKFNAIYWNTSLIEKLDGYKINCNLENKLSYNNYKDIDRWIKDSRKYLKPNGKLYIGHSSLGNLKKLEYLLDKYGYEYNIITRKYSSDIRGIDFLMYEAKLRERFNKVIIVMPFTGKSYEEIVEERKEYNKKVKKHKLKLLESFIGIEEKDNFEKVLYKPDFIVNKDINLINKANVMLVDLSKTSAGATFEVSYAKLKREIPIIGFGCPNELTKRHPWYNYYCDEIVNTIDDALDKASNILK